MPIETEGNVAVQGIGGAIVATALACHMSDCSDIFPPEDPFIPEDPIIQSGVQSVTAGTEGAVQATMAPEAVAPEVATTIAGEAEATHVACTEALCTDVVAETATWSAMDATIGIGAELGIASLTA